MFRMNEFRSVEWNILLLRKLNFIVPFLIFMLNKLKIKARFKWHWLTMDSWNFRKKTEHLDFSWQKKNLFWMATTTDNRCCWKIAICVCYTRSCYSTMCIVPLNQLYFNMLQKWLHSAVPNPTKMQNGADLN